MKHIKLAILSILLVLCSAVPVYANVPADGGTVPAGSTPKQTVCETLGSGSDCTATPANGINVTKIVTATINVLSVVVGVVAVIMIIVGGLRFITSNGDGNSTASARNTILYAIIGLVIVAMAQFLVQFVLDKVK